MEYELRVMCLLSVAGLSQTRLSTSNTLGTMRNTTEVGLENRWNFEAVRFVSRLEQIASHHEFFEDICRQIPRGYIPRLGLQLSSEGF